MPSAQPKIGKGKVRVVGDRKKRKPTKEDGGQPREAPRSPWPWRTTEIGEEPPNTELRARPPMHPCPHTQRIGRKHRRTNTQPPQAQDKAVPREGAPQNKKEGQKSRKTITHPHNRQRQEGRQGSPATATTPKGAGYGRRQRISRAEWTWDRRRRNRPWPK